MAKIHWTRVVLYDAGGSGLTSEWDVARACVLERHEGRRAYSAAATNEHLRALEELREEDSCANWFTDAELAGTGPRRDTIDWTDFPGKDSGHA